MECRLKALGYPSGDCWTRLEDGGYKRACEATLRKENDTFFRLIKSACLSRPEHYFSIYQSGCNHNCLKCHSAEFSKYQTGSWYSTDEIARVSQAYSENVTVFEPRERATMWHGTDLCRSCGSCVLIGKPGALCPGTLRPEQVLASPQGFGPARNVVAFTGGDIACQAEFYAEAAKKIKLKNPRLWVLMETNGYGLVRENLDVLKEAGVDSFWLDIKAYEEETYRRLCGTTNKWILRAPEEILNRGFVLEVLVLFIPTLVETDQIIKIARLIYQLDPFVPFTILAFFPANKLMHLPRPNLKEMVRTYKEVKGIGLVNVKLGNVGVFARTENDMEKLISEVGLRGIG